MKNILSKIQKPNLKNTAQKLKGAGEKFKSLNTKKKILVIAALVLVICLIVWGIKAIIPNEKKVGTITAKAEYGDVVNVIEGTGTIEAINQYEIKAMATGDILEDFFEEGDVVEKGQLMYKIDTADIDNNISRAENSVEKARMSYSQSLDAVSNLTIQAPFDGVITGLYIKRGDDINQGTKVCDIINKDVMKLKIKFNDNDAENLYVGQSATVNLESSFTTLIGKVTSVSSGAVVHNGVLVRNVEIEVNNPGTVMPGDRATALVGNYACNSAGTLEYLNSQTIYAKASGEVYSVPVVEGDRVKAGNVIARLESDQTTNSATQSRLSLTDAQLSLDNYYDQMDNYNVTAPISGNVVQKNIKAGETIDNSNNSTVMAIIADLSTLVFEMSIDELDVNSIAEGQRVTITADAVPGKTFEGYVDNVSIVGTSSNGVTSYPVKIVVENGTEEGLIPGMNVSASIEIESRENVLRVPVSAVRRGNMVYVKGGTDAEVKEDTPKSENIKNDKAMEKMTEDVPSGYKAVRVETGLTDANYVEIVNGLNEGDEVLLPDITSGLQTMQEKMQGMMSGGGMPMGGGMPSGNRQQGGGSMPR